MRSIGRDPLFIARGEGCELIDVDGNRYVDYVCSWGPLIHGHAHPDDRRARSRDAAALGTSFGAPTPGEVELADEIVARVPSVEMVRMTSSGTEASMSALRLARAVDRPRAAPQVRRRLPRPRRRPARRRRLRPRDAGDPRQPRRPGRRRRRRRSSCRGTTATRSSRATSRPRAGRDRRRAVPGQHGPRPARSPASSSCCASAPTDNGALLVFDEVISGFRVAPRRRAGAQRA